MPKDYLPSGGGLVIVRTTVPVLPPAAWQAITRPDQVRQWFADLSGPLTAGAAVRADFGDGDFFDLQVDAVEPGQAARFRWRFLGVGPESQVRWEVNRAEGEDETTVTVRDSCEGRPPAEAAQLEAGWQDFLDRLGSYLRTGESARYAWREVIDGGTNLPAGTWQPLAEPTVADWLPIASDGIRPRWFFTVDDEGPRRFAITDWKLVPGRSLHFTVAIPQAGTTEAAVQATRTENEIRLTVSHDGWKRLGLSDMGARSLRHRFAAAWSTALKLADDCAARPTRPSEHSERNDL